MKWLVMVTNGIKDMKEALRAGLNCYIGTMTIEINLIALPRYVMSTTTLERTEGLSVLNQPMTAIRRQKNEEKKGLHCSNGAQSGHRYR